MRLTDEQEEILEVGPAAVEAGGSLRIIAFAGAGKTTTLKALAGRIRRRGCYLAFNRAIAEEARAKFAATRCTASTMHSLAFSAVRGFIDTPAALTPKDFRASGIIGRVRTPALRGWGEYRISSAVCRTLAAYCASADEDIDDSHAREAMIATLGDPDTIRDRQKAEAVRETLSSLSGPIADMTRLYWQRVVAEGRLSHDVYLKIVDLDDQLRADAFRGFRYLMVDEAQDLNPVQRSILRKAGLPVIAVGDPYQQIYSWRGAENALALLDGGIRHLTRSFRFGEDIAAHAREILASRPDGGPPQRLTGAGPGDMSRHQGARVAIICRTNIGAIDEALKCAGTGVPVQVDNLDALMEDLNSAEALHRGVDRQVTAPAIRQFDSWTELCAEAEESGGALQRLVRMVEDGRTPEVRALAERQRSGRRNADVLICTAHRSKGLEFPAVILGRDWKGIGAMRKQHRKSLSLSGRHETLALEEWNALYVAATRAIVRLKGLERILRREPEGRPDPGSAGPADGDPGPGRTADAAAPVSL